MVRTLHLFGPIFKYLCNSVGTDLEKKWGSGPPPPLGTALLVYNVHRCAMLAGGPCSLVCSVHRCTMLAGGPCSLVYSVHRSILESSLTVQCPTMFNEHSLFSSVVYLKIRWGLVALRATGWKKCALAKTSCSGTVSTWNTLLSSYVAGRWWLQCALYVERHCQTGI